MSKPSPHFLAIDQGGHASRAIVFDASGCIAAEASVDIGTTRLPGDRVEHDPEELANSVLDSVRRAVEQIDGEISAAGLATQRSSIACWDRNTGAPLSPVISWQDRRAAAWLRQFENRSAEIHALTGLVLSPHYGASKLRWCLDHLPEVQRALEENRLCCGPLASFLLSRLLEGNPLAVDPANGSRTLLWDCAARRWSPKLLELFGVPESVLPRCVPTRYAYGRLRAVPADVPLEVCTGDQSAALFAFGEPGSDTVYVNAGTGAFLQRSVGNRRIGAARLLSSVVWESDGELSYVLEGTVNGAGSALRQVGDELRLRVGETDRLTASGLDGGTEPPLFLNGVSGLGSPWWRAVFPSRFIGDGEATEKLAGVAESVVFMVAANLEEMARAAGTVRRVVLTGGIASMDGFCRRLADLTGLAVERPAALEATARGLAWLVAGRPASWMHQVQGERFEPGPDPALERRFKRWRAAMDAALN
jgi:glycerol kinase